MPFGNSPASEEFKRRMDEALVGLIGVKVIHDDILIYGLGTNDKDTQEDHDKNLIGLMDQCRQKNTLSRAYIIEESSGQDRRSETEKEIETVNAIQFSPITAIRCKTIQSATAEDEELQILSKTIDRRLDTSNQYEFTHTTSSPRFPQSNGKVENAIKTAKRLIVKSHKDVKDPYLALLDWRNTSSEGLDSSPSQRMFGRRGRTLLPSA
ncbi:unnamed protein product [Mytilus edulis]|uniref:Integrase catalytic domain-containing protein n=1 Tax=Mytilus edulis TaxID=6550 RepID=A0A8S3VLD9_MYTED|nr:unnamed protein product [Mytilus edulis]